MWWPAALLAIGYPYLLGLNLLFILYWLFLWKRVAFISVLAILLGYGNLRTFVQLNLWEKAEAGPPAPGLKLMSFNARLFDLYNWTDNNHTRRKIFRLFQDEKPQVLCLQEFYTSLKPGFENLDSVLHRLPGYQYHVAYTETKRDSAHWGIATFSQYPIVGKGSILFYEKTNNLCIYTDLKIGDDTLRVYNIHFQSNSLRREDYEFLDKPNEKANDQKWVASKNILKRLRNGAVKRSKQVDEVAAHVAASPYPVVLCGDFNDPPSSYTYRRIGRDLKDAFVESGYGVGNTYNGLIPLLRIDYILHDARFSSRNYHKIKQNLSDHYPIQTELLLPE